MTLTEIEARITALVTLGGWSNSSPAPDYTFLANEGLRILTRQTMHIVEDYQLDIIRDQILYEIDTDSDDPRQWIAFNDDAQLNDQTFVPQTTRDNLRVANRNWRSTPSATPVNWYWAGPHKIGLYPAASASGGFIHFQGPRHEPRLVNGTDTPILEEDFHEGICLFGAWHHGKLYARGAEREIAASYFAEGEDYVNRVKEAMDSKEAQFVVRHVQRAPMEYVPNAGMGSVIWWRD